MSTNDTPPAPEPLARGAHGTVSRAMQILDVVVSNPGATYAEITRSVGAPKSSVYGFIRGMLAVDWLIDRGHRLYLGPAFHSLVLTDGQLRAGTVTSADLEMLYRETGLMVVVSVRAGDYLIDVAQAGSSGQAVTSTGDARGDLLTTAGGKILLAFMSAPEMNDYLHRRSQRDRARIDEFLQACANIRATGLAVNISDSAAYSSIASVIRNGAGYPTASVTLTGNTTHVLPRVDALSALLREQVGSWAARSDAG